ncbi:MAG: type IV secretion protein Rhs, partial [Verrucomicrobia bacterium]|nr:type IV secretion protein Rhs [Verrucomicrobiota bacterium]
DNAQYSPTSRKGEYFCGELYANNSTGAVWLTITNVAVLNNGANPDIVASTTGRVYVPKTTETFAYDADGNLTNDSRWSYTWDAENRVTSFTRNSSAPSGAKAKVDCEYDARWRRTQKIVSMWNGSAYVPQSTNRFVYDGWNLVAILNHTNGLMQSFTWGTDASGCMQGAGGVGGLISMTVHQGTNAGTYFYWHDGNHNVVALVNAASGAIAGQWEYDAFGNLLRATGTMASENPFLFSTKFYDWDTGFYYYGYR